MALLIYIVFGFGGVGSGGRRKDTYQQETGFGVDQKRVKDRVEGMKTLKTRRQLFL